MAAERSRRSFFADLLSTLAGGWVTVTGLVTAASALGGCGDDSVPPKKYGGVDLGGDTGPVVKYGGTDLGQKDLGPVVKYGGTDGGYKDVGPVVKYGGTDGGYKDGMTVKYGGKVDLGPVVKYGGTDAMVTKYGGFPG